MLSQQFPLKTMFMAVAGRPVHHLDFNGKIFMERVSSTCFITSTIAHSNFRDDTLANNAIKHEMKRSHQFD